MLSGKVGHFPQGVQSFCVILCNLVCLERHLLIFCSDVCRCLVKKQISSSDFMLNFRKVDCKYAVLGCSWEGVKSNQQEHESACEFPKKNGADLMTAVVANLDQLKEQMLQQRLLIQMLSCERISICGKLLLKIR